MQINAEKSPYLVDKLRIWMLPTLALIRREKTVDYVVGFNELGGTDDFSTEALEARLAAADVVTLDAGDMQAQVRPAPSKSVRQSELSRRGESDEDSDFD